MPSHRRRDPLEAPPGLFDRAALALAGATIGLLTLLAYVVAAWFIRPKAAVALGATLASPLGLGFIAASALAAACLRPARMADLFGFLWGEHAFWSTPAGRRLVPLVAILLFLVLVLGRSKAAA